MPHRRAIDIPDPELSDAQWDRLAEWLPEESASPHGGPKPVPNRPVVEGILWSFATAAVGRPCPADTRRARPAGGGCATGRRRASGSTCGGPSSTPWRRGPAPLGRVLRRRQLRPGEKRGPGVGKNKRGKGTKWMVVVDGEGVQLACHLASASPAEVRLLEPTLDNLDVRPATEADPERRPKRLVCDKGYDSDPLRERLEAARHR